MSNQKAQIYWDRSIQAYRLKCTYDMKLIDFLKKVIPVSDRTFDPSTKIWTFTEKYLDGTVKLCNMIYGPSNTVVLTKAQVEASYAQQNQSMNVKSNDALGNDLAEFMRLIPFEAAQKAYRSACQVMHPDKGGDMEKMSRLNVIWNRIEKEVYKQ